MRVPKAVLTYAVGTTVVSLLVVYYAIPFLLLAFPTSFYSVIYSTKDGCGQLFETFWENRMISLKCGQIQDCGMNRDNQRRSNVQVIAGSLARYAQDNGSLPFTLPHDDFVEICRSIEQNGCSGVNVSFLTGSYLVDIPRDPQSSFDSGHTNYFIRGDVNATLYLSIPKTERSDVPKCWHLNVPAYQRKERMLQQIRSWL